MKIRMLPHTPDLIRHSGHGHGGGEGPEAYLRNAEKAKSHPFPRSGRPSPDQPERGLSQAEEYCAAHTDAGADYLQAAPPRHPADLPCCGFPAPPHGQKGRRQKRKRQKKASTEKYASATGRFPSSQTSIPNEGRNFIPALFIQLHEVTREKINPRARRQYNTSSPWQAPYPPAAVPGPVKRNHPNAGQSPYGSHSPHAPGKSGPILRKRRQPAFNQAVSDIKSGLVASRN